MLHFSEKIMFFIFIFVSFSRIGWDKMNTEKLLLLSCSICNKEVRSIRNGTNFEALPNSECSNPNTTNMFCNFINETKSTVNEYFKKGDIPANACSIIGPCVPQNVAGRNGTYCYSCRFLSSLLYYVHSAERERFLTRFCASSRGNLADFCSYITDGKVEIFLKSMEKAKNANQLCDSVRFCHRPKGNANRRSGRIIFKKREEL